MLLTLPELDQFIRLQRTLMFFVNQRLKVIPNVLATPEDFADLEPKIHLQVRDASLNHPELLEAFVEENPAHFSAEELAIVQSWRHQVSGKFFVFRELKKYTVFLTTKQEPIAYGVLALSQPFEEVIGPVLPVMVQTVLLPFQDKIVYDGLITRYNISFGPGVRRSLNESFKEAKDRHGIITSLPITTTPKTVAAKTPKAKPQPKANLKEATADAVKPIIDLIDQFCRKYLNEEYAVLCRRLAEKLGRKRPSPLLSGSPNTWASGIVRTVGWVNFLQDKSQTPHMLLRDIDAIFGISESTGAAKLKAIRTMLRIHQLNPEWTLPSQVAKNPMIWILQVNGLPMDVRPREVQEMAFKKGLIPYIPADRPSGQK